MKKSILITKKRLSFWAATIALLISVGLQAQSLKHSYKFENGDATDDVGGANGTIHGGVIENGRYHATLQGNHISLPGDQININDYAGISLEAYIQTPPGNAQNTMFMYFGRTASNGNGSDYLFVSAKSGGESKASMSCLTTSQPWTTATNVTGNSLEDNLTHHLVVTVIGSKMEFFVDGSSIGSATLSTNNRISNLSNELVYLCKSGYQNDPSWLGAIDEINIYEGILTDEQILVNANVYFSTPTITSVENGVLNNDNSQITSISPTDVETFLDGLEIPRDVSASIIDGSGNEITSSGMALSNEMSLKLSGNEERIYALEVRALSAANLVEWAFGGQIAHDANLIASLPSGLFANQFLSGIKISEYASARLLSRSNEELAANDILVSQNKVEITAENGDTKTYSLLVGSDVMQDSTIAGSHRTFNQLPLNSYTLGEDIEWHILDGENPIPGSKIDLTSDDIWIYFHNIKPQRFHDHFLNQVSVNGEPAVVDQNVRLVQYSNGSVLISHSSAFQPLTVYTGSNMSGESKSLGLYTYYKPNDGFTSAAREGLGTFEDNIESFVLKKGYMASFSANSNGTGASEVFIADKEDIVVNTMPSGLNNSVSFIRVFPWRWVNKKGFVGNPDYGERANTSWTYCHCGNGSESSLNNEKVAFRHNPNWPSYGEIQNKRNITHGMFFNEPNNPVDDGYATVEEAIAQYPNMLASGLRMVSPRPTDGGAGWLIDFVRECRARNYRLDAVAIHFYRGCQSTQQFYDFLKYVHDNTGLPVWVTEWNNGCNWSGENCIPDSYEEQAQVINNWVDMLESAPFVERYSIWDGCTQYQQFWSDWNNWTPSAAGRYYIDKTSRLAYTSVEEHDFHFVPQNQSENVTSQTLSWLPKPAAHGQHIYFGKEYPPKYVTQVAGDVGEFVLPELEFNETYYWRVDEYNSDGTVVKGDELEFSTYAMDKAGSPFPENESSVPNSFAAFNWTANQGASSMLYLGESPETMSLQGESGSGVIEFPTDNLTEQLEVGKTYYWRVDQSITLADGQKISGKGDVWSFTVSEILSSKKLETLTVYPNPANDLLNIAGLDQEALVEVFDITGQKVMNQMSSGKLSLNALKSGIYILYIEGQKVAKFAVKR